MALVAGVARVEVQVAGPGVGARVVALGEV